MNNRQPRTSSGSSTNAVWSGAYTRTVSDAGAWRDEKSLILASAAAPGWSENAVATTCRALGGFAQQRAVQPHG